MTAPEAMLLGAVLASIWLALVATWRERRRQRLRERQLQFAREGEAGMMEQAEVLYRVFGWSIPDIAIDFGVPTDRVEGWAAIWKWPAGERDQLLLEIRDLTKGGLPLEARTTADVTQARKALLVLGVNADRLDQLIDAYAGQLSPFLPWATMRSGVA